MGLQLERGQMEWVSWQISERKAFKEEKTKSAKTRKQRKK